MELDEKSDGAINLETLRISPEILRLIAEIDEFKGAWRAIGNMALERLARLRRVATIESIGSSTRIEGAKLTDSEVERLLSGLQTGSFATRDEQEVAGYSDAMTMVFEGWEAISVTENHIKQLHRDLLAHSDKDVRHRGEYKKLPNHVEAFDEDGRSLGVVFATVSPFDTPRRMSELIAWLRHEEERSVLHPLLVIAIFHVVLLEIHPFQDGNGRLSRVLTTLMLLRAGYAYAAFSSLESVIEQNKESYYLALSRTQSTIRTATPDWSFWLDFFVRALQQQKLRLEKRIERERIMIGDLPPLSSRILDLARERGRLTVAEAVDALGASRNTIKDHLKLLRERGHLDAYGAGRGVWYAPRGS